MWAGPITRKECRVFCALAAFAFVYIGLRAWCVPITHDEAMTFFLFVETGAFLPFSAHLDAGNHVLCTALASLAHAVFGLHAWALRLPSVLVFLPYAWSVYQWGALVLDRRVRWVLWAVLLLFPFQIEFFALFRGYALGWAFLSIALLAAVRWWRSGGVRWGVLCLLTIAAATWSNLSLITVQSLLLAGAAVLIVLRHGRSPMAWSAWVLSAAAWVLAVLHLRMLSASGALYYGNELGIVQGAIASLLPLLLGVQGVWAARAVALFVVIIVLLGGNTLLKRPRTKEGAALVVLIGVLVCEMIGRVALFHLNGTLYPEDRTAMPWALLVVLITALTTDRLAQRRPVLGWGMMVLLVLPCRTLFTAQLDHTTYWPSEAVGEDIRSAVLELRAADPDITLGTYHQLPGAWAFGLQERGSPALLAQTAEHPFQGTDLLLIDPLRPPPPAHYRRVLQGATGHLDLYRAVAPPRTLLLDTVITRTDGDPEYLVLWEPDPGAFAGKRLRLEVCSELTSIADPLRLDLVCEVAGSATERVYDGTYAGFVRPAWNGDTLRTVRVVDPVPQDADRLVLYYWNKYRQVFNSSTRLRVFEVGDRGNFAPSQAPRDTAR